MRKILFTLILACAFIGFSNAQDYNSSIGGRLSYGTGLTYKHFLNEKSAFEGLLFTRWRGINVTALYEIHQNAFDTERFNWFYGFGAHVGLYDGANTTWGDIGVDYTIVGIDGIIGLEYTFTEIPINVSIDYKPALNIVGDFGFWGDNGAFSIRYVF